MPSSREAVTELRGAGYSRREIAGMVGRSERAIGQIERGEKPYRNLEGTLSDLARRAGETPRDVAAPIRPGAQETARRTTAEGGPARVRGGVVARTRTGRVWEGGGPVAPRREIERAAARGLKVKLRIHALYVRKYRGRTAGAGFVDLFEKGGYDAGKVLAALDASGEPDVRSALADLALQRDDVEAVEGVYAVTITSGEWADL
jgi:transcriptional regulator with XRE-family HTH domain